MEQVKSKKKGIIVAGVSVIVLIAILGISFAFYNYSRTGDNQILVAGDIYMKFTESNQIGIPNALPNKGPGEKYFQFTIEGKNTYNKPIWYEIDLQHGEPDGARKTRIADNLLKFRLVEIKGEAEETVVDNASYVDLINQKIWVNTIDANTNTKVEITYRLYMWISDSTIIGNTSDAIYDMETWNDVYASIKVNVSGDFNEKELDNNGVNVIKNTLGNKGGVIGVSNTNEKEIGVSKDIREYRYSGLDVNNYVYFNCKDGEEQNAENCETWRIVGVFKDENGSEFLKIVRNEVIKQTDFPDIYTVDNIVYNIKATSTGGGYAYWNYNTEEDDDNGEEHGPNDWTAAGLQYWLNGGSDKETNTPSDGYMSYLSKNAKGMIADKTKYYLGTVTFYNQDMNDGSETIYGIKDTVNEAYKNERAVTGCIDDKGPSENSNRETLQDNTMCRVWANNAATWEGKIALLYSSDYGYSADSKYWNTILGFGTFNGTPGDSSWLQQSNHEINEFLVSPASSVFYAVANWNIPGNVSNTAAASEYRGVRPTLYLKSNIKITSGDGTEQKPYNLEI